MSYDNMTDMDGTQAVLDPQDEEVIQELVPPRHARWKIAVLIIGAVALIVGGAVAANVGLFAPRLTSWVETARYDGNSATLTLRIRNTGSFPGKIESVRIEHQNLLVATSSTDEVNATAKHGKDVTATVRITAPK